jgi:thymidylate synthase (FAD)
MWALEQGIAKEQARAILPEGMTPSRMYMNGTMRSWIFYLQQRLDLSTQKEHREIAELVLQQLRLVAPITINAFFPQDHLEESFSI